MTTENKWQKEARAVIQEYAECESVSEKITLVEYIGDRGLDLAVLEEVLRFAVIGAVRQGLKT